MLLSCSLVQTQTIESSLVSYAFYQGTRQEWHLMLRNLIGLALLSAEAVRDRMDRRRARMKVRVLGHSVGSIMEAQ